MAQEVSTEFAKVRFEVGNGTSLPFADDCFDVVVMHTLLSHVHDQAAVLSEARRVLNSEGLVGDLRCGLRLGDSGGSWPIIHSKDASNQNSDSGETSPRRGEGFERRDLVHLLSIYEL